MDADAGPSPARHGRTQIAAKGMEGPLLARMTRYRNPGSTQSTNIKIKANIRQCFDQGKRVDIYVLPDHALMQYGKFHVNLVPGLKDSIMREVNPLWHGEQKKGKPNPPTNGVTLPPLIPT